MPISDLLIDAAAHHDMLSFMDGHTGYNQIFIDEVDVHKTAFRCPGALGTYEWVALATPPILVLPRRDKPLKLYISRAEESIGCLLAQDTNAGREQAIFYLSRNLNTPEINYSPVEKLCLALFFAKSKLQHYMLPFVTQVIAQTDVIRYMLTRPIVKGRIGEWTLALSEFSLQYVPQKAVKGQALADFLAQHPSPYGFASNDVEIEMVGTHDNYWTMYFNGSSTSTSASVGVVIKSPHQHCWFFSLKLDFDYTNNQAEYEALVIGLSVHHDLRAARALVFGDSELVINQLNGTFRCMSCILAPYHMVASYLTVSR
ncbi:uncharacterized protein LOC126611866 [Malus sylvestris]|uniref:uncharacterized protein LOC126611866 n=1 Tax=Malus sylvestris TaxID=3752 RepID=UPI0021ABE81E|nr:uncharacterized protein LOC126611866 [Malus sylvestris]